MTDTNTVYLFLCFDNWSGKQDIVFYGEGRTEEEALVDAQIPWRYEVNEAFALCSVEERDAELIS